MIRNHLNLVLAAAIATFVLLGSAALASLAAPYRAASIERFDTATFHVLLPTSLPPGARLLLTDVRRNSDGSSDVDVFYELPDGGRLHLWETNRNPEALGSKNPLNERGVVHEGVRSRWIEGTGFSGRVTSLNGRVGEVLVSIDATMPASQLLAIAESVR